MTRDTVSGRPATNPDDAPVPSEARRPDGQYEDHWVLPPEERAKGYVRPLRRSYVHVGIAGPRHPLRDLTEIEARRYAELGYVKFEVYPPSEDPVTGRFWTQDQLDSVGQGCGAVTRMPEACAETYARDPSYYGSTFCCCCNSYRRVGEAGEFVWDGTDERVGT